MNTIYYIDDENRNRFKLIDEFSTIEEYSKITENSHMHDVCGIEEMFNMDDSHRIIDEIVIDEYITSDGGNTWNKKSYDYEEGLS